MGPNKTKEYEVFRFSEHSENDDFFDRETKVNCQNEQQHEKLIFSVSDKVFS